MSFQTVAHISLAIEFVVISAIILTLLNAVNHGRPAAAVARLLRREPPKAEVANTAKHDEPKQLRRAA
jgi:hypothetical protein